MNYINDYFEFMDKAVTATQSVDEVRGRFDKAGFKSLDMSAFWGLESGGKYYVSPYPSMIVGFTVGTKGMLGKGFNIIGAHTDNPAFKIKPNPEIKTENMITLNVERYGGPIFNTWFDRPLSIAGRVATKSEDILKPEIHHINFNRPLLTLPNLAIHMNREVNKGKEIKVQSEMLPLMTNLLEDEIHSQMLMTMVANEIGVETGDILDADLYVYCFEKGLLVGAREEFISCPRIDDLAMVYAGMQALIEASHKDGINMAVFIDNEEIGSVSKQGADSAIFNTVLDKIKQGFDRTDDQFTRLKMDSFIISADGAHGLHPNYVATNDITSKPVLNKGVVIKSSANLAYASEVESVSAFQQLCTKTGVSYQRFVNHSDQIGGKTIGPLMSRYLPVPCVDVGVAMLGMHSTRELMGTQDFLDVIEIFRTFYSLY